MGKVNSEWIVSSPLYVIQNKTGKKWYLNLNHYRNTHYQTLNTLKVNYLKQLSEPVRELPEFTKIELTVNIYAMNKRLFDIDNVATVHIKFFLDTLVRLDKLIDDSYIYVPKITTQFIGVDKDNPRVDMVIKEIE